MVTKRLVIVFLGCTAAAVTFARAADTYTLQLNLKAGQHFKQRMKIIQENTQGNDADSITTNQEATMDYGYEVQSVDAGGIATVRATYLRVASQMRAQGVETSFDSDKGADSIPARFKPLYALVGKSFTMKITPKGKVLSVTGLSKALEGILKDSSLEGKAREQFLETMKKQFGDEAMKTMMEKALNIYPSHPVAIGDSWSKTVSVSQMVPLTMENTWTLKEVDDKTVTLDMASVIRPAEGKSTVNMSGLEVDVALQGTQSGVVVLDRKSGWTLSSNAIQSVYGTMSVPEGPRVPKAMSVPITMRSSNSLGPIE